MKNLIIALVALAAMGLTSCVNVKEEIWVESNNKVTVDYSLEMPASENSQLVGMLMQSVVESTINKAFGGKTSINLNLNIDASVPSFEKNILFADSDGWRLDSILLKVNEMDEDNQFSAREKKDFSRKLYAIGNKSFIKMAKSEQGNFSMALRINSVPYNDLSSVGLMIQKMRKAYPDEKQTPEKIAFFQDNFWFKINGNTFERGKLLSLSNIGAGEMNFSFGSDNLDMKESLFFTSIVHLPKKVKSVANADAVKETRETVVLNYSLKELSDGKSIENKLRY